MVLLMQGDVDGSVEAILSCLDTYSSDEVLLDIVNFGVGQVSSTFLCNGGSLYAPYSLLSISNMLCGGRGNRVVTSGSLRPCFQGQKVWALD
jgi:hypothetical protein